MHHAVALQREATERHGGSPPRLRSRRLRRQLPHAQHARVPPWTRRRCVVETRARVVISLFCVPCDSFISHRSPFVSLLSVFYAVQVCFSRGDDYVRGMRHAVHQAAAGRVVMSVDCTALLNQRHVHDRDDAWQTAYPALEVRCARSRALKPAPSGCTPLRAPTHALIRACAPICLVLEPPRSHTLRAPPLRRITPTTQNRATRT